MSDTDDSTEEVMPANKKTKPQSVSIDEAKERAKQKRLEILALAREKALKLREQQKAQSEKTKKIEEKVIQSLDATPAKKVVEEPKAQKKGKMVIVEESDSDDEPTVIIRKKKKKPQRIIYEESESEEDTPAPPPIKSKAKPKKEPAPTPAQPPVQAIETELLKRQYQQQLNDARLSALKDFLMPMSNWRR